MMNKRMFLGTATAVALFVAGFSAPAYATDPDAALKDLMAQVNSKGPNGVDPGSVVVSGVAAPFIGMVMVC